MTVIDWAVTPPRHVEPWPLRKGILFVAVGSCVLWGAVAVLIGGG